MNVGTLILKKCVCQAKKKFFFCNKNYVVKTNKQLNKKNVMKTLLIVVLIYPFAALLIYAAAKVFIKLGPNEAGKYTYHRHQAYRNKLFHELAKR